MAQTSCVIVSAAVRDRLRACRTAITRESMSSGHTSCSARPIGNRRNGLLIASGLAGRRCGVGKALRRSGVASLAANGTRKPGKPPDPTEGGPGRGIDLHRTDLHRTAASEDPLDRVADGPFAVLSAAHMAGTPVASVPLSTFKWSRDPAFATKLADTVGLYLDPPARAVGLSFGAADQARALPDRDPRLQTPWHHDPVRRAQCARRNRHRPLHAAPHRVHRPPQRRRARSRTRHRSPSCTTTTTATSTPEAGLARAPPALDLPLHPDLGFLAQLWSITSFPGSPPTHPARRLPLDRRTRRDTRNGSPS
jgi:hypothetical protein